MYTISVSCYSIHRNENLEMYKALQQTITNLVCGKDSVDHISCVSFLFVTCG